MPLTGNMDENSTVLKLMRKLSFQEISSKLANKFPKEYGIIFRGHPMFML